MTSTSTVKRGYDAWVISSATHAEHGSTDAIHLLSGAETRQGFLWMPMPKQLAGRTVANATLTAHAFEAVDAQTITFRPLLSQWQAGTITYSNRPSTTTPTAAVAITSAADGGEVTFDVTTLVQAIADGLANYGWRLETTATSLQMFASFDSGLLAWTLEIEYDEDPEAPTTLSPNGTVVGSAKPVVTFDFTEYGAEASDLASVRVEIDLTGDGIVDWDSDYVATSVPALDLAAEGMTGTVSAGQTVKWRAYTKDVDGRASDPSDWATYTYRPLGTGTLLSPASGVLYDPTSDILASLSGATLEAYQIWVTDGDDRTSIRYNSGKIKADDPSDIAFTLPLKNRVGSRIFTDDLDYQIHVRMWDTYDREGLPALDAQAAVPVYVDLWTTVHFDDDDALDPPTSLQAEQVDDTPWVQLTWTDVAAADAYLVSRDDEQIAKLDPADTVSSASTYTWTDMGASPGVEHIYKVRRLTNGVGRSAGRTDAVFTEVEGVWLLRDNGDYVVLDGDGIDQLDILERRLTFTMANKPYDVDILTQYGGLAGPVQLSTEDSEDQAFEDAEKVLKAIKKRPTESVQLIYATVSKPVRISQLRWKPDVEYRGDMNRHQVLFNVQQVGDFDFRVGG